jgi:hypothetical protein
VSKTEWEVRTADNLAVRVPAESAEDALEVASAFLPEGAEGSAYVVVDEPVGIDGTDPEDD